MSKKAYLYGNEVEATQFTPDGEVYVKVKGSDAVYCVSQDEIEIKEEPA